uniref:Uncharacterized protein n=1 Tax=mine drainage metagenome TaxID=410659 RepID=E6QFZ5_9ZZZZ
MASSRPNCVSSIPWHPSPTASKRAPHAVRAVWSAFRPSCCHHGFDLGNLLGYFARQNIRTAGGHQHVVFDANPDTAPTLRYRWIIRREVQARFHRQHHPRLQFPPGLIRAAIVADVMNIHAQPVPRPVHIESLVAALLDDCVATAGKYLQLQQAVHQHLDGLVMIIGNGAPYLYGGDCHFLTGQNDFVNFPLCGAENPVHRQGPGDVSGVGADLCTGVDQYQIAIAQFRIIFRVVQNATVDSATDDTGIRHAGRSEATKNMLDLGGQFVFQHTRTTLAHAMAMPGTADAYRRPQDFDLFGVFEQPHLMDQVGNIDHFEWVAHTLANLALGNIAPVHDPRVEIRGLTHGIKQQFPIFQQLWKNVVQVMNREATIHLTLLKSTLQPSATPIPGFPLGITGTAEQDLLPVGVSRCQHQYSLRLCKAGQIEEIAVAAEWVLYIAVTALGCGGGYDRDTGSVHLLHQQTTAGGMIGAGQIKLGHLADLLYALLSHKAQMRRKGRKKHKRARRQSRKESGAGQGGFYRMSDSTSFAKSGSLWVCLSRLEYCSAVR